MLAGSSGFEQTYHKRDEYFERGPSICRYNAIFTQWKWYSDYLYITKVSIWEGRLHFWLNMKYSYKNHTKLSKDEKISLFFILAKELNINIVTFQFQQWSYALTPLYIQIFLTFLLALFAVFWSLVLAYSPFPPQGWSILHNSYKLIRLNPYFDP